MSRLLRRFTAGRAVAVVVLALGLQFSLGVGSASAYEGIFCYQIYTYSCTSNYATSIRRATGHGDGSAGESVGTQFGEVSGKCIGNGCHADSGYGKWAYGTGNGYGDIRNYYCCNKIVLFGYLYP